MKIKQALGITVVFLLFASLFVFYFSWQKNYQNRLNPGIKIGNFDLGGKTFSEAREIITTQTKKIEASGIPAKYADKEVTLNTSFFSFDSDLAYPTLNYEVEKTINALFNNKKNTSFLSYLYYKLIPGKIISEKAFYSLNENRIKTILLENFKELEIPAINASFVLVTDNNGLAKLVSEPEKIGKKINYDQFLKDINFNLENLNNETIIIKTQSEYPDAKQVDLIELEEEAKKLIGKTETVLNFIDSTEKPSENKVWKIENEKIISWLSVQKENSKLKLSLDQKRVSLYLTEIVAPDIKIEAITPRFEMKDSRVSSWQSGKDGRELDIENSAKKITEEILNGNYEIELITKELKVDEQVAENNFKIKEIIGTGVSDFSGSPKNRQHNIKVGADSVHGLLIKPGEEFSLVKNLGVIDETSDYLPELVIKGNKTIYEYGGGLCQIGTTIFRSALASGLPITARQNHSYRVSYYEPAGTDAAVYDPWPDVRFINDTGNYILIQSRIEGNLVYFDFWGVSDGRISSTTKPVIYNIVKPEPSKLIETDTLKPGEKKCTERAHNGADAYFDYKVIYPEGATTTPIQERRFSSHYVPWPEVCLIGAEATSTPDILPITETASSSVPIITTPSPPSTPQQ